MVATPAAPSQFQFDRDTFAFRNELVWEYSMDETTGEVSTRKNVPAPTYAHRCFVLVRSARQFLFHARFDPAAAPATDAEYAAWTREVVARSPRRPSAPAQRVLIPGYADLRSLSRARPGVVKASCGGAWQSYFLRSHWRMVFPFPRGHQAREAAALERRLAGGWPPIVHLVRFPQLTINHGLLLFASARTAEGIRFRCYDPNLPEAASFLDYSQAERTFRMARNHYWAGGRVDVYETYRGWLY